jgi:uncharacterized phage-associated protein
LLLRLCVGKVIGMLMEADMAETTAGRVADYIIGFSHQHGDPITNLKLQKLLYYSQAWFLAFYDKPLFDERIEAWVHGPAVPPVYGNFKEFGWQPIGFHPEESGISPLVDPFLDEVMKVYSGFSAYDLERLTHSEDPWILARGDTPPDEPSNAVISHDSMKNYYKSKLKDGHP